MGPAVKTLSSAINFPKSALTAGVPLKKSIQTLVSTRFPELFTVFHSFQLEFFQLLPVQANIDLPAEGEKFLLPTAADVFFDGQADGFSLFPFPGDFEEVVDQRIRQIQSSTHLYHLLRM